MPIQQLSTGGASAPVAARDATSQAAQNNGFDFDEYQKSIEGLTAPVIPTGRGTPQIMTPPPVNQPEIGGTVQVTPTPGGTPAVPPPGDILGAPADAPAPPPSFVSVNDFTLGADSPEALGFTGAWEGAKTVPGNPYAWDPYSFAGAGEGQALQGELESPGYKNFGDTWLDLINTISTQNLQWGGTNQYPSDGFSLKGGGSVGPWLSSNIVGPWNEGNQEGAYNNALYFISSQTGKPATDPQTQQLAGSFLEYTLQNNARYGANTRNFEQRRAAEGGDKGIFGPLLSIGKMALAAWQPELAPFIAAESFAESAASGNTLGMITSGLSALGGGLSNLGSFDTGWAEALGMTDFPLAGVINPSDAAFLGELGNFGNMLGIAGDVAGGIGGLMSGDLLGAVGSGVNLVGAADSMFKGGNSGAGTTGSNATASTGIMGSLANTLGITPAELNEYLKYGQQAGQVAGVAIPLAQRAMEPAMKAPEGQQQQPTPVAKPVGAPFEAKPAGEPIEKQMVHNPSQANYREPGARLSSPTADQDLTMQLLQQLAIA